jgi:cathepsin D
MMSAVAEESEPLRAVEPLKTVKLQRTSVILPKMAARAGKRKNFYSATINVGKPAQQFHVSFDLGGGTMVLPSQDCTDSACLERHRYNKWNSETAEDIQANGKLVEANKPKTMLRRRDRGTLGLLSIDVGSGKVRGNFVRDEVCVNGDADKEPRCFPLSLLAANSMSDLPFLSEPYDGTVGLGLKGMSLSTDFNFLASFQKGYGTALPMNSFGLHIGGDEDGGEITFGGYDVARLTHPLKWASVVDPQEGRWQIALSAIRIGNHTIDACNDRACRAAMDYSSSLLSAPSGLAASLEATLAKLAPRSGFGDGCQHVAIPDIHLDLVDGATLTVPSEDFVDAFGVSKGFLTSPKSSCEPLLSHHDEEMPGRDVFILGEATLRRYYTFFDADSLKVGFSLAASSSNGAKALSDPRKKDELARKDNGNIIVLVQVQFKRSRTLSSIDL